MFLSPMVFATDIDVIGNSFGDIQNSIDSANSGDTINLGNRTYTGVGNQIKINGKNNLIIRGYSTYNVANLDAENKGMIFLVRNDSSNITFKYINFVSGNASIDSGAAIRAYKNIKVESCIFSNNIGASGAAIYLVESAGNSVIIGSKFINNKGIYHNPLWDLPEGGAIDSHASNTLIKDCFFKDNMVLNIGGAVNFALGVNNQIIDSVFINNSANNGGSVSARSSSFTVLNCDFKDNKGNIGGAIYLNDTNLAIRDSNFDNNQANDGGAIFTNSVLDISSSIFSNNKAKNGGAIYTIAKTRIIGSKLYYNLADCGSAIYSNNNLNIESTNFVNNKAKSYSLLLSVVNGVVNSKGIAKIEIILNTGNNAINAIYGSTNANLVIDSKIYSKNVKGANQKIILYLNNEKYVILTDNKGIASFFLSGFKVNGNNILKGEYLESDLYTGISNNLTVKVFKKVNSKNTTKKQVYKTKKSVKTKITYLVTVSTYTYTTINEDTKKVTNSSSKILKVKTIVSKSPDTVTPPYKVYCSCGVKGYTYGKRQITFIDKCSHSTDRSHRYKSTKLLWNPKKVNKKEGEWTCKGCGADYCAISGKEKILSSKKVLKKA